MSSLATIIPSVVSAVSSIAVAKITVGTRSKVNETQSRMDEVHHKIENGFGEDIAEKTAEKVAENESK